MKQIITTSFLFLFVILYSQEFGKKDITPKDKFEYEAYGVVNYYAYDWDTDPYRRNAFDTERLNIYLKYNFNNWIQLKTEIEFEHGGTGSTMELDKFEEAGEFESEVEKGGEVKLEQINLLFKYKPWLNFRVGRVKLYMGNASKIDLPTEYFTGYRSRVEDGLIPVGWYENGVEILGDIGENKQWSYKLFLVNGLNSEEFSSANWIKRGHQQKFEMINAENFATSLRLDYNLKNGGFIGLSAYHGNTNNNRSKPKLDNVGGQVSIIDAHANIDLDDFKLRGMFIYGNLRNSDKISDANNNLPNALNAKRTPVAKNAMGYYAEVAYNILPLIVKNTGVQKLYLFGRYDYFDSMHKMVLGYFDNPRWERSEITFGANYLITPQIIAKAHYAINKLGMENTKENKERTFLIGMGFAL